MKNRGKWAILIASAIIVSMVMVSTPVAACFSHTTTCSTSAAADPFAPRLFLRHYRLVVLLSVVRALS